MSNLRIVSGIEAVRPSENHTIIYDFKNKNRLVNLQGKYVEPSDTGDKYQLIAKEERQLTPSELRGRRCLAVALIVCSLGLAYFAKCVQKLWTKTTITTSRFAKPLGSVVPLWNRVLSWNRPYTKLAEMPHRIGLKNSGDDCFLLSVLQLLAHIKPLQEPFTLTKKGEPSPSYHFINEFLQRYSESTDSFSVSELRKKHFATVGLDRAQQDPTEVLQYIMKLGDLNYSASIFQTLTRADRSSAATEDDLCFHPLKIVPQTSEERRSRVSVVEKGLADYFARQKLLFSPTHFTFTLGRYVNRQNLPLLIKDTRITGKPIQLGRIEGALAQRISVVLNADNTITGYELPRSRRAIAIQQGESAIYLLVDEREGVTEIDQETFQNHSQQTLSEPYALDIRGTSQTRAAITDELEMDFTFQIPDDYVQEGGEGGRFTIKAFIYRPWGGLNSGHYAACIQHLDDSWQTYNDAHVTTISPKEARRLLRTRGYVFYSEKS